MKSSTWWQLRRAWHSPKAWKETQKERLEITHFIGYYLAVEKFPVKQQVITYFKRCLVRDLKIAGQRFYRWILYTQPLRCNGNRGGWRTQFCEWLENKAREAEDREYN